jgi:hypothetical protein
VFWVIYITLSVKSGSGRLSVARETTSAVKLHNPDDLLLLISPNLP